jgi:UDP-N-acetyl-D-mannosaminuronic acid dehydrogenase
MKFNKVCVLGLGYIGLPTASMFATNGIEVIGVDVNPVIAENLQKGEIHIRENGLQELVLQAVRSKKFTASITPDYADAFIIAVPTPITQENTADMRMVISATEMIAPFLRSGNLVVLESTSPPKTTTDLVKPILERTGLIAGKDFLLAYSPERVLPGGNLLKEMKENARIIGGFDHASSQAGKDLYATFVNGEITCTDATTAEMVKLMENTFRDVNIALANEFALIAEKIGVDVWKAIELANKHPRVKILKPGPGVGGHCIAVDPWFLVEAAPQHARIIRRAREVNNAMPKHVADLVDANVIRNGTLPVVAVLGLAYKANVDDARESPAIAVVEELDKRSMDVRVSDPWVDSSFVIRALNRVRMSVEECVDGADCLVLLTDHAVYQQVDPFAIGKLMRNKFVIDTRNCIDTNKWAEAGFEVVQLGHSNPQFEETRLVE